MAAITIDGKEILVAPPKFPSNEVKEQLGGRWDKSKKVWRLAPTSLNVIALTDWYGREILEGAPQVVRQLALSDWGFAGWGSTLGHLRERAKAHPYWEDLYEFQQEGVEYLTSNPHHGAILALSPGLGKTATAVVAADVIGATRILVLAPLTLAKQWISEFDYWSSMYRSFSRATRTEKDPKTECVVSNHEVMFEVTYIDEDGDELEILPGNFVEVYDEKGSIVPLKASPVNMKRWIEEGPKVFDKRKDKKVPARKRVVVPRQAYLDTDWDIIIVDESVLLKNRKALKVDIVGQLSKYAANVWELSGSPTAKFRTDLFPQVKTIMPRGFTSYWRFAEFFCTIDKSDWGWKIDGDRPDHDPQSYLRDFMFVRNQKDVLPELPDYLYDPIEVELNADQRKAFRELSENWTTTLESGKQVSAKIKLAQMTRLAQITSNMVNVGGKPSSAKLDLLAELIDNDDIEFPLLVWTWWVPTADAIADRLERDFKLPVDVLVGAMDRDDKDAVVEEYKSGELPILIAQMGVGKFGHNLQETKTVFYHDRHWDSDAYLQSLRRVKRIGLEHRPRLIVPRAPRSTDPVIEENLSGKLQSVAKVASHDLVELLQSLGAGMVPWSLEESNFDILP